MRGCFALPDAACHRRGPFMGRRHGRWSRSRGGLSGAQIAENAMLALSPSYQFRADTVTLSGGNIATIKNRLGADALVLSAGTLAAPAADALFGGAQSIIFSGTQWLDSNLGASAWKFLHDGTGEEVFLVFAPRSTAAQVHYSTLLGAAAPGHQHFTNASSGTFNTVSPGPTAVATASLGAGVSPINTATYHDYYFSATGPLVAGAFAKETAYGSLTAVASAASSANPAATLRLGAAPDNANPSTMRFCELLIFPRVLHEYERQIVREYIAARYAIAAPSLTGADRDIMSLLPFAWPDAVAYTNSAGNASAFLDRARPGHSFAQGTTINQVLVPTADAALANALSAAFSSTKFYVSSLAAAAWTFLHDGSGMDAFHVFVPTDVSGINTIFATYPGVTGTEIGTRHMSSVTRQRVGLGNGTAVTDILGGITQVSGTGCYQNFSYGTAQSPQYNLRNRGVSQATGSHTPSTSAPAATARLGSSTSGGAPLNARWSASPIFNRVLSAADRAKIQAALLTKYGLTP